MPAVAVPPEFVDVTVTGKGVGSKPLIDDMLRILGIEHLPRRLRCQWCPGCNGQVVMMPAAVAWSASDIRQRPDGCGQIAVNSRAKFDPTPSGTSLHIGKAPPAYTLFTDRHHGGATWAHADRTRYTDPLPRPGRLAIFGHSDPLLSQRLDLSGLSSRGWLRPLQRRSAFALPIPSRWRSSIISRSKQAIAPVIVKINCPVAVFMSTPRKDVAVGDCDTARAEA
jgi:hypothetical protein